MITISGQKLSDILDISTRYLRELASDGVIVKVEQNKYDLKDSIQNYMKYKNGGTEKSDKGVGARELGEIFGLSEKSIRDMSAKLIVVKLSYGIYDLEESCKNYIDYLKLEKEKKSESDKESLQKIKSQSAKLDLMEKEGRLHDAEAIRDFFADTLIPIKSGMRSIPASIGKDLANETDENKIRAILLKEIDKTLRGLADYPRELFNGN